jgi:hypothetical protein
MVHHTASEYRPADDGSIFVIAERKRDIALPVIRPARARALPPGNRSTLCGGCSCPRQRARALQLMASLRRSGEIRRTPSREEFEGGQDDVVRRGGRDGLNAIRDEALWIAPLLN